jgi:hypothetical protein
VNGVTAENVVTSLEVHMIRKIILPRAMELMFSLWLVQTAVAQPAPPLSVTIADKNSSLKFTIGNPSVIGGPNDPTQLPRTLEWTVDGRTILVYPSAPSNLLDIGHLHSGQHVKNNQMHAQGPHFQYGTGAMTGNVTGGIVYTVEGGQPGSRTSRISEKVRIHNKTGNYLALSLAGLGYKPPANPNVPDLTGLDITGTTVVYYQGSPATLQLTDGPPFGPLTILPLISFSGFNPLLNQTVSLAPNAYLVMITELNVSRKWPTSLKWLTSRPWTWLLAIGFAMTIGMLVWRRLSQRR